MTARGAKAMAGVAAAAVALGVTQLLAVLFGPEADARTAVARDGYAREEGRGEVRPPSPDETPPRLSTEPA